MDFSLIKRILAKEKTKIVIVENGVPTMIISSIEDYLSGEEKTAKEKIGMEKIGMEEKKESFLSAPKREEDVFLPKSGEFTEELTIDDLPL